MDDIFMVMSVNLQFLFAIRNTDIEKIQYLIKLGANTNYCDPQLGSAIITAVTRQNLDVIALLISHGANVNKANHFNVTPIEVALKVANPEVINLLVAHGAILKERSSYFYLRQIKRYIPPFYESKQSY